MIGAVINQRIIPITISSFVWERLMASKRCKKQGAAVSSRPMRNKDFNTRLIVMVG